MDKHSSYHHLVGVRMASRLGIDSDCWAGRCGAALFPWSLPPCPSRAGASRTWTRLDAHGMALAARPWPCCEQDQHVALTARGAPRATVSYCRSEVLFAAWVGRLVARLRQAYWWCPVAVGWRVFSWHQEHLQGSMVARLCCRLDAVFGLELLLGSFAALPCWHVPRRVGLSLVHGAAC